MAMLSDQAVVLRKLEFSETSEIVVLFTRLHGRVRAIAKGVRRSTKTRFSPGIDFLDTGTAALSARADRTDNLATLTEFHHLLSFSGIRSALPRLNGAAYMAEATLALTEDWDPHVHAYDVMLAALAELDGVADPLPSVSRFQKAMLEDVGALPRFDGCVRCGSTDSLSHFSPLDGGMVCACCARPGVAERPVSAATLRAMQRGRWDGAYSGIFRLFDFHMAYLLGRELRLRAKLLPPEAEV